MTTKIATAIMLMFLTAFISERAFSQTAYDGEGLSNYLGKSSGSSELKDFLDNYHCHAANESHYLCGDGVEVLLKNNLVTEINLYKNSPVYGSFKGKLPKGLTFGMTSAQVKAALGKPTASYSSGYCEFDLGSYALACWFEAGSLNQVEISTK